MGISWQRVWWIWLIEEKFSRDKNNWRKAPWTWSKVGRGFTILFLFIWYVRSDGCATFVWDENALRLITDVGRVGKPLHCWSPECAAKAWFRGEEEDNGETCALLNCLSTDCGSETWRGREEQWGWGWSVSISDIRLCNSLLMELKNRFIVSCMHWYLKVVRIGKKWKKFLNKEIVTEKTWAGFDGGDDLDECAYSFFLLFIPCLLVTYMYCILKAGVM